MKKFATVALILATVAASSTFAADAVVKSNNTRAQLKQSQGGLLNNQQGSIGSIKGKKGTVSSNNTDAKLSQDQGGLLNNQAGHIGSINE
ncbi:MAG: hypothetical protein V4525_13480 [Pseudomonadota bacterium]